MSVQRKLLSIALILVSLALLYPGVTQPVLTLSGTVEKSKIAELGIEMIAGEGADNDTRQMLGAISSFLGSGLDATINYTGGDGNDVAI